MLLVEILDAGSLSKAARNLRMTRANVSYHLTRLEKSLGSQLIRRTTRQIEPTEIGRQLYQHGLAIQNEILAAREAVASLSQGLIGRVRLSMPSGFGQIVMSPWLIEFKRLYPGIVLDLRFENRVDDLLRDEVDIAIRVMSEPPEALVARDMGEVRYLACAAAEFAATHGMPGAVEQLRTVPLITSAVIGRKLRVTAYHGAQRREVDLEPTLISENFSFLRQAVLAGLGVGLVPDYLLADEVQKGNVVTALDEYRLSIFGTGMYLLYMQDRLQTRAARTLIDFVLRKSGERNMPASLGVPGRV